MEYLYSQFMNTVWVVPILKNNMVEVVCARGGWVVMVIQIMPILFIYLFILKLQLSNTKTKYFFYVLLECSRCGGIWKVRAVD